MRTVLALLLALSIPACRGESAPASSATATDGLVGKPAPEVVATAHDGQAIDTRALKGKHVVLYFYPKDETPGCTKEACAFRDAWKDLETTGVVLVGVSTDDADSHKKFAEHHRLPFHLITDKDGAIAKAYGVPNTAGFLGRQTFVIGPDGNVKKVYRSVDVSKHASEILADVKS
jgi:thioredoxin-dependent peroxiredoxin